MRTARKWIVLTGAALLLVMSVAAVSAAPNTDTSTAQNAIPGTAASITGATQTIAPNGDLWYKFNYNANRDDQTGRTPIYLTMPNGTNSELGFEVYTPAQINDWWSETPIGRGTAQRVNANGVPVDYGQDASPDLSWVGKFGESGTYYVRVTNANNSPMAFVLTIKGQDVTQ